MQNIDFFYDMIPDMLSNKKLNSIVTKLFIRKDDIGVFKESTKPQIKEKKEKKALTIKNATILLNGRQRVLNAFESGIFPKGKQIQGRGRPRILGCVAFVANVSDHKQLKILTLKEILQRFPITLSQVKSDNTSEHLLDEICQVIYSLHSSKEVTKKVYENIRISIKL